MISVEGAEDEYESEANTESPHLINLEASDSTLIVGVQYMTVNSSTPVENFLNQNKRSFRGLKRLRKKNEAPQTRQDMVVESTQFFPGEEAQHDTTGDGDTIVFSGNDQQEQRRNEMDVINHTTESR